MNSQQIFNLVGEEHFYLDDFCVSQSNQVVHDYLFNWPNWNDKILNIFGPKKCGKTFLLSIFADKYSFYKISCKDLTNSSIENCTRQDKLIIEDIDAANEEMLFLIFNDFKLHDKYLIFSSQLESSKIKFKLNDLHSRFKSLLNLEILNPTDNLLYQILLKQMSTRQIKIDKDLLLYAINRMERTYDSINKFVDAVDRENLINKKKINLKLINKVLQYQ